MSGSGRHGGYEGFKNFSNPRQVIKKSAPPAFVASLPLPPYTPFMKDLLRKSVNILATTTQETILFYVMILLVLLVGYILKANFGLPFIQ